MTASTTSRYLAYLPAIFQERTAEGEEPYLGQFLLPFEQVLTTFETLLAEIDRNFAPAMAPAEDFLPWLSTWIALVLDEEWPEDRRRHLLSEAVELYRWRGTVRGLKRYLEIYTGLKPENIEIHQARWPAGMQIGIASRIGARPSARLTRENPCPAGVSVLPHDDYVVDTTAPTDLPPGIKSAQKGPVEGQAVQLHYQADKVEQIKIDREKVMLWYRQENPEDPTGPPVVCQAQHKRPKDGAPGSAQPNISRHNQRLDYCYRRAESTSTDPKTTWGGTFLIDQVEAPYRFVVEVRGSPAQLDDFIARQPTNGNDKEAKRAKQRAKLLAILNLEKPAHTEFYLKFTATAPEKRRAWMQIEVHSSIGLDTTIG